MSDTSGNILRVDFFAVPQAAREAFLRRVKMTHEVLHAQKGFIRDRIVERSLGQGTSRIMTIVEWEDQSAIAGAVAAVKAAHAGDGFNSADFIRDHGIVADLGFYDPVA